MPPYFIGEPVEFTGIIRAVATTRVDYLHSCEKFHSAHAANTDTPLSGHHCMAMIIKTVSPAKFASVTFQPARTRRGFACQTSPLGKAFE